MKKVKQILILILTVVLLCGNTITVFATGNSSDSNSTQNSPSDEYASKEWKDQIRGELNRYYTDLKARYKLTEDKRKRMDKVYNNAMSYMENAPLTMNELRSYKEDAQKYLEEILKENIEIDGMFFFCNEEGEMKYWRIMNSKIMEEKSIITY